MKSPFRRLAATCIGLFILTAPAHSAVVPGQLMGLISGSDSVAGLLTSYTIGAALLARIETPSSVTRPNRRLDYLAISRLPQDVENESLYDESSDHVSEFANAFNADGWPSILGLSLQ